MVLNTKGGSNAKKIANKHVNKTKSGLRLSENKNEIYGIVKKLNGNTFDVLCYDKKIRRCILRGKFKGRGKRDNLISTETWVLIGLRDFSTATASATASATATATTTEYKLCDLLEVYSSSEKESLKRTHGIKMEENDLNVKSKYTTQTTTVCSSIDFVDETTIRYQNMIRRRNVDTDSELDSESDSNSDDSDSKSDSDSDSDSDMPMHKQVAAPSIMMINVDDI
jgi:translation initiation factor IF-1